LSTARTYQLFPFSFFERGPVSCSCEGRRERTPLSARNTAVFASCLVLELFSFFQNRLFLCVEDFRRRLFPSLRLDIPPESAHWPENFLGVFTPFSSRPRKRFLLLGPLTIQGRKPQIFISEPVRVTFFSSAKETRHRPRLLLSPVFRVPFSSAKAAFSESAFLWLKESSLLSPV